MNTRRRGVVASVTGPFVTVETDSDFHPDALGRVVIGGTYAAITHRAGCTLMCAVLGSPSADLTAGAPAQVCDGPPVTEALPDDVLAAVPIVETPAGGVIETGLKAVDLFCPVPRHGSFLMLGGHGAGRMVFRMELCRRMRDVSDAEVSLLFLLLPDDVGGAVGMLRDDPRCPADTDLPVHSYWLPTERAKDPDLATDLPHVATAAYFSPVLAARRLLPAIDQTRSSSQLLTTESVGTRHAEVAARARELMASAAELTRDALQLEYVALGLADRAAAREPAAIAEASRRLDPEKRALVCRARRLERYMTQAFGVVEHITGLPSPWVPLEECLADVAAILDGEADDLSEEACYFTGSLADARKGIHARDTVRFW